MNNKHYVQDLFFELFAQSIRQQGYPIFVALAIEDYDVNICELDVCIF